MPRFIKSFCLSLLCLLLAGVNASSETIVLKSHKTVQGNIVERTDKYIEIDIGMDMPLTFYFDEILRIEQDAPVTPKEEEADTEPVAEPAVETVPEPSEAIVEEAQEPVVEEPDVVVKPGKSFLWKIETQQTTVYLLGSIHLGKKSMYPLPDVIEEAYDNSDILVVEVDSSKINPKEAQAKMLSTAMYSDGERLERNISQELLVKLRKRLRKYGLTSKQFSSFKPWFVGITLAQMQLQELAFDPTLGVDHYFVDKAKGKKRIIGLETYEQQLEFLNNMPHQDKILEQSLISLDEVDAMFNDIVKAWQEGDADKLDRMITQEGLEEFPHLEPAYKALIFDRNIVMAEKIKEYLESDQIYFVVVGSAHLVGEKGIVEILKRDGYTVEQL